MLRDIVLLVTTAATLLPGCGGRSSSEPLDPPPARTPIARGHVWATLQERDLVPEGTTWDPVTRSLLLGSLNKNKIVAVAEDGTVTDRVATGLGSVVGIHVDRERGILWVASTPRFDDPSDTTTAALIGFDAATGAFLRRVDAPEGPGFLNDLTTGRDGTVYVTDSRAGKVLVLMPEADTLGELAALGTLRSPNGITISDDGRHLFVADRDRILVLALAEGRMWPLEAPDTVDLSGIDGLAWADGTLVAHHPLEDWRIARYMLDAGLRRVTAVELIERSTPDARTSTTGEVVGDTYYYIGNSQLDRMNTGTIDAATMQPVRLYRATLGPEPEMLLAVALSAADSVAFFDGLTLRRSATVAVGSEPHEVLGSRDGRTLWVADTGSGTITVLEVSATPRVRDTWRLPDDLSVHDLAMGRETTLWAVSGQPALLLALDASTGRVLHRHPLRRPGSWMVDASDPSGRLTIANLEGGAVTLFDPATEEETILEGREGEIDAAATPDASHIWSVNAETGDVTVFDPESGSAVRRRRSGGGPTRVIFTPGGGAGLVVHAADATVVAYDVATTDTIGVANVGPGPKVVALRPDGRLAYVTHPAGRLSVIDVPSMTVLHTLPLAGGPDGVAVVQPGPASTRLQMSTRPRSMYGTATRRRSTSTPMSAGAPATLTSRRSTPPSSTCSDESA